MEMHWKPDHCQSAADVMEVAASVRERRKKLFSAPKPIAVAKPEPPKMELPVFPQQPVMIEITAEYLASFDPPTVTVEFGEYPPRPTIRDIQKLVCIVWKVNRIDLLSHRRTYDLVLPRHIVFVLARALTFDSLPQIGRQCGDRDHTTVLYGIRKYDWLLAKLRQELTPQQPLSKWVWRAKELLEARPNGAY